MSIQIMKDNSSVNLRIRRITKNDLMILLNKNEEETLNELTRTTFGFMLYLEERRYIEENDEYQILEILLEILGHAFSICRQHFQGKINKIVRMLKDSQEFLFKDIPRVLNSCMAGRHTINLVQFMFNYMTILKTLLHKDFFPHDEILNQIFPMLENYMNRLQERRIANLDKAAECFKNLSREVERCEHFINTNNDEDDSEIANFRSLSIVPRSNDIVNYEVSNIPHNIIDAPYKNVDHFLSVHYRLTREDMLRSFRECVKTYIQSNNGISRQKVSDTMGSRYYEHVSVGYPPEYTPKGIFYDIKVSTSREIDWSKKDVLLPGSLIFLTPDKCNSVVFATVARSPKVDFNKSKTCRLKIKLEDDLFQDTLSKDEDYAMIEPSAYFECYKHVLSGIKEFSESSFPLSDIITYFDFSDPVPEYLYGIKEYCLHEKCDKTGPEEKCSCKVFDPLKDNDWPLSSDLELDDKQYNAFKLALTKKVAVIQGPPGTGKTYIGAKVVRSLLRNVDQKPIIICCLTNHALDQFLERMLDFTKKIVRLGGQSKSKELEPHFLRNLMYAIRKFQESDTPQSITDPIIKKSIELLKKIAYPVLHAKIGREMDEEFSNLKILSDTITAELISYSLCQDKYLDDSALNDIIDSKYKTQLRHASGTVRKSLSAGLLEWLACSHSSDLYDKCRNKFYEFGKRRQVDHPQDVESIWTLTEKKRYELFYNWRKKCLDIRKKKLEEYIESYTEFMKTYKCKSVDPIELEILRGADIVGVTTTGACKFKTLLRIVRPCIIVIEEAAQVLESHVIATLVPSIQHLILIGDHEQLRPLPADNELSEKYNLKISMFERLFHNKAPSATLVEQHRMKPCIAELLVPRPYTEYSSFENVYKYEEIKGIEPSVFFFDHRTFEDDNSGTSLSNDFEARMVVSLAKYLNFIHYTADRITILTTYALQARKIHDYLQDEKLNEIHVTTVDNFQGEENDIILLSFVRSNPTAIGFLKESNRVCVALSRARMGMFCFGNFQLFADRNELWAGIVEKLREKSMIGDTLILKCPRHDTVHSVQTVRDILQFLNGCSDECNFVLPCQHVCSRKCHFVDSGHLQYLCKQPCTKMIDETRVCPRLCFQKCKKVKKNLVQLPCGHFSSKADSKCYEEIQTFLPCFHQVTILCHVDIKQYQCKASENTTLDCGHKKSVYCFQKKENMKVICTELRQELSPCGHTVKIPCSMHFEENELLSFCDKSCGALLDCEHPCDRLCRDCLDTGIHGFCKERCELVLTCGHKCEGFCGSPCPPCKKKCFISCGHRTHCSNVCLRPCIHCPEPCLRKCRHKKCSQLCWEECSIDPCTQPCQETLPCGHQCVGLCGETCPFLCRICNAEDLKNGDTNNCFYEMQCKHVVEVNYLNEYISNCLLSFQWPCCPECAEPITNSTRYKNELKQAKKICIDSCDTTKENSNVLYLVHCMYGKEYIIPAQFIDIHNKILKVLKQKCPDGHTLMVLKNCVMFLKKLVIIASELNEYNCDEYIQGKFSTLMKWIYRHLTEASFQQLRELGAAVEDLKDYVNSRSILREKCDYFSGV